MEAKVFFTRHRPALAMSAGFGLVNASSLVAGQVGLLGPLSLVVLGGIAVLLVLRWILRPGVFNLPSRSVLILLASAAIAISGLWRMASDLQSSNLGMPLGSVTRVTGRVFGDSQPIGDQCRVMVHLQEAWSKQGVRSLASGDLECRVTGVEPDSGLYDGQAITLVIDEIDTGRSGISRWQATGRVIPTKLRAGWDEGLAQFRQSLLDRLCQALDGLESGSRGLSLALLLGRQAELDPPMKAVFYQSGCAHLVALSGMHVALVAWGLVMIVRPLIGVIGARVLGILGAMFFIWLVGPFPSAIRALVMFVLFQGGCLLGYRVSLLSTLALTGPIICLIDPRLSQDLGYLLSFYALLGILLVQAEWRDMLRHGLKPWLAGELAGGMAAQCATMPLLLLRGMPVCLQGFVAALVLGPLSLLYLALSALSLALGLLIGQAGTALPAWILQGLYQAILAIGRLFVV